MNRRDFLKVGGVLSAAAMVTLGVGGSPAALPVEAWHGDQLYRGTSDGKIFVSRNAGDSWKLLTNFGSQFSVFALTPHLSGALHAYLDFQGYGIELRLDGSGTQWMTL